MFYFPQQKINNWMSVAQAQKSDHDTQKDNRMTSIYDKFQKAQENMSSFKQMLTKFSTNKKASTPNPIIEPFNVADPFAERNRKSNNLVLCQGWEYSGETFEQKFHGYGILMQSGKTIYSGDFKNGKMDGKGILNYNEAFEDSVSIQIDWAKYEGQFRDGFITGFGNLYQSDGLALIGYWQEGRPLYYTKINALSISL